MKRLILGTGRKLEKGEGKERPKWRERVKRGVKSLQLMTFTAVLCPAGLVVRSAAVHPDGRTHAEDSCVRGCESL